MSKKGLSADEKKIKLMEIFTETKEFFKLVDLEKLGAKKGVVMQTVKPILEELVSDCYVHQEKIGAGVYFWAYPSERSVKLEKELYAADGRMCKLRAEMKQLGQSVSAAEASREKGKERTKLLEEYEKSERELREAEDKLAKVSGMDPDKAGRLERLIGDLKALTNHYTENVSAGLIYLRDECLVEAGALRKELGIPDDFEDLEL